MILIISMSSVFYHEKFTALKDETKNKKHKRHYWLCSCTAGHLVGGWIYQITCPNGLIGIGPVSVLRGNHMLSMSVECLSIDIWVAMNVIYWTFYEIRRLRQFAESSRYRRGHSPWNTKEKGHQNAMHQWNVLFEQIATRTAVWEEPLQNRGSLYLVLHAI